MKLSMIIQVTYFTIEGKKVETFNVKPEDLEPTYDNKEICFPGDVTNEMKRRRLEGRLPKVEESEYHILLHITTEKEIYTRFIPYDYVEEYIKGAERTYVDLETNLANNLHMVLGMSTEVGELQDNFKRELAYDKAPDRTNLIEEVGDMLWYIANFCRINGINIQQAMSRNINKLRVRFPEKFRKDLAINRNLEAEKDALTVGDVKLWIIVNRKESLNLGVFKGKNENESFENMKKEWARYNNSVIDEFSITRK